MSYTIKQSTITNELKVQIYKIFSDHAIQTIGINGLDENPVFFEISDHDKLIACVGVQMFWGQLHIKYLVVEKLYRNQGLARQLMEYAFSYGKSRGCNFAFVETMSFQAPEFYQKLGFTVDFIRYGYDQGTSVYYFSRIL